MVMWKYRDKKLLGYGVYRRNHGHTVVSRQPAIAIDTYIAIQRDRGEPLWRMRYRHKLRQTVMEL